MPEVYNWQLGRKMLYPYEERHPKWQFAFVFNINRCLACQTCSMADKSTWLFSKGQEYMWWNNVETKPYGGYPQFYDVKITQLIEQVNPGGQVWNVRVGRKHHAVRGVRRDDHFRCRRQDRAGRDRVHSDGPRVAVREYLRGHGDVDAGHCGRHR